jgi:hypothetical protein
VAEVAPKRYAFVVGAAPEIAEGPFCEDVVEELDTIVKTAAGVGFMGRMGNAAAGVGATMATGIAISLAGDLFDATKRGLTKTRNYRKMMEANPDLDELPATEVQKVFNVLHRFNPDFASEPTVAGHFVRTHAKLEGAMMGDPRLIGDLVKSRSELNKSHDLKTINQPWKTQGGGAGGDGMDKRLSDLEAANDLSDGLLGKRTARGAPQGQRFYPGSGGGQRTTPGR